MKKGYKRSHVKQKLILPTMDIKCTSTVGLKPAVTQLDSYHSQIKQTIYVPAPPLQRQALLSLRYGDLTTTQKLSAQIGLQKSQIYYSSKREMTSPSERTGDSGNNHNGADMCGISLDKTNQKFQLSDFERAPGHDGSNKPAMVANIGLFGQVKRKETYMKSTVYTMPHPGITMGLSNLDKNGIKLDKLDIAGQSLTLPHLPSTPFVSMMTQTIQESYEASVSKRTDLTSSLYNKLAHPGAMQFSVLERKHTETFQSKKLSNDVDSFHKRRDYGKNLEKNWLRQMREETRKQKQADRLEAWMKKHMKPHSIDLDTAFYSSDSDLGSDGEEMLSNVEHQDVESQDSTYIRLASTDVGLSDTGMSDSSAIETYLQDGQIKERYVKGKERRRRLRHERKYTVLIDDQGVSDDELEYQKGEMMTDVEIRTMRLKLEKKKINEWSSIILNDSVSDLQTEIAKFMAYSRKVKNRKHKKKKSHKTRISIEDANIDLVRESNALRIRFLKEYGFLLTATDLANLDDIPDELDTNGEIKRKSIMATTVMEITSDIDWDKVILPSNMVLFTEDGNKYTSSQPRPLARRRNSYNGNLSSSLKRFEKRESEPRKKTITKKRSKPKKSVGDAALVSNTSIQNGEYIDDVHPEDLEPAESTRQLGYLKRPLSGWMFRDNLDKEIKLRELTEGIDFPAKEIKLQIAERRLRKQRQKALARQQKLELGCESAVKSAEDDDAKSTYNSEGEHVQ